jgi:antirestriction protein ArdC
MLWSAAIAAGFAAPIWMTFKQALELGGHVRRGEKGSLVVYADRIARTDTDVATGEESEHAIPFLKSYTVFNVEQIDDLPERFRTPPAPWLGPIQRIDHAEAFFTATGADIRSGGNMAAYNIAEDRIAMPPFELFRDAESYYATLAHEVTHWTRHPTRLGRNFGRQRWGDAGYAREKLVAELGAAFLSAELDRTNEPRPDHAAYLASWIAVLKEDKRAIFIAAAHAQRAADYLRDFQD